MSRRYLGLAAVLLLPTVASNLGATTPDPADESIRHFLAQQDDPQHPYRAMRRLEAESGSRRGWVEAVTEYSAAGGFRYQITGEGGSGYIRTNVLRAVLDGERDLIAQGEAARSSLVHANYTFQANGLDIDGLANVLLVPRRKEPALVAGTMFLRPGDGDLVRLQGRLAKNPSFWVKNVDIVRSYERIGGAVVPVALESKAQVRLVGAGSLRMTYEYLEIDGQPVTQAARAPAPAAAGE